MDCNTARLFLSFRRPASNDFDGLDATDLEGLDHHLAECSECNALAVNEQRFDQSLGQAMRAVEVPAALRGRILDRLAQQRHHQRRRRLHYAARGALAAAVMLAVGLGWYFWHPREKLLIDPEQVVNSLCVLQPSVETVNDSLKRLGERHPQAPSFVQWGFLACAPSIAELPGYKGATVPQLVFRKQAENEREAGRLAIVYILGQNRFQLDDQARPNSGYKYTAEVFEDKDNGCNYLVLYTGDSWAWLRATE